MLQGNYTERNIMTAQAKQVRLNVIMQNPYYSDPDGSGRAVFDRWVSKELQIEIGEDNWRDDWYSDPYFNVSVPIALELALALPIVKVFKLWYDPKIDFHHIEFDYD